MPFPPYSVWNGIRISPRHLPPVPNPSYLFEGGLAVEVDKSALADFRPSCQAEGSRAGERTSLLTQSIGEGFYKQLCAEEGFESSLVLVAVRCRFSWDTECEAGGER